MISKEYTLGANCLSFNYLLTNHIKSIELRVPMKNMNEEKLRQKRSNRLKMKSYDWVCKLYFYFQYFIFLIIVLMISYFILRFVSYV